LVEIGNWTAENCTTEGTGDLLLSGAIVSGVKFKDSVPSGEVWYAITDGLNREAGIGVFNGNDRIVRQSITATLKGTIFDDDNPSPLSLDGTAIVACTFNALAYRRLVESIEINAAAIADNALAILQNASDISDNADDIEDNRIDIDLNRDDIDTILTGYMFDEKLAGYANNGLHLGFNGDLNDIGQNSCYVIFAPNVTNKPSDMPTEWGVITTDMWVATDLIVQTMVGMNGPNQYKTWQRQFQTTWTDWKLVVDAEGVLPSGGVIGDILVKQSSDKNDALWGNTLDSGYFI